MDFYFDDFLLLAGSEPNFISPSLALNVRSDRLCARNRTQFNSRKTHVEHITDVGLKAKLMRTFVYWKKKCKK